MSLMWTVFFLAPLRILVDSADSQHLSTLLPTLTFIILCPIAIQNQQSYNPKFRSPEVVGMSLISSVCTRYLAWSHSTPLPDLPGSAPPPVFQHWHIFNRSTCNWEILRPDPSEASTPSSQTPALQLLTWNIDAFADRHESRTGEILSKVRQMVAGGSGPDIIFFQEVSKKALAYLLRNDWVRDHWISSEADETNWADVPFASMTLLSRPRFNPGTGPESASPPAAATTSTGSFSLGSVCRIKYPSRFKRDALCCDILWDRTTRIRLINVHLDSLPIQPNLRPQQVAIAADLLRTAGVGRGVIGGDWNPVTEQDLQLVQENRLVDAWEYLHPGEDGFTWGLDGQGEPFPPGRLDKIATLGLELKSIKVVSPGTLQTVDDSEDDTRVPCSDHSGLICSFTPSVGITSRANCLE